MTEREILISGASELGFSFDRGQVESLLLLLSELDKWNKKINLTSIISRHDAVIKHVLDSLAYLKGFGYNRPERLLDMGSGAGFPAFPIKIADTRLTVTLVESVKKKTAFLRHITRQLGLRGAEVLDVRLEDLPTDHRKQYNAVTARAFASMPKALSAAAPFLAPDGVLVLSRGPEENISDTDIRQSGYILETRLDLVLPHSNIRRSIWTFKKLDAS